MKGARGEFHVNKYLQFTAALTLGGLTAGAIAHGGATAIVKERMDAMSAISKAMKTISQMMQGKEPYDAAAVRLNAATIKS
ncbi:MAG: cytochrome c, partial [Gammaproteobacteria bacterium]|nr:cytochrome c [Gammaproteobacteria bacterium]